jgi:diguanylate cyclase (GGDEF)-like protein/PAS domain S-box-containing protein
MVAPREDRGRIPVESALKGVRSLDDRGEGQLDGADALAWARALDLSAGTAIITVDGHGLITAWNLGAERLFGYRADEVMGRSVTIMEPPDLTGQVEGNLSRILAGESIDFFETERICADGRRARLALSISPITDASGIVTGGICIAHDLTPQHARIRQSEDRLRALVQNSGDVIAIMDEELSLVYANPRAQSILGFDPEQQPGASFSELLHQSDAERVIDSLHRIAGVPGLSASISFRIRNTDGQWRHILATASSMSGDQAPSGIVLNGRDVTEKRINDSWFRQVLETAEEGIWTVDTSSTTTFVNQRMADMLGRSTSELIGQSAFTFIREQAVPDVLTAMERNFTTGVRHPIDTVLVRSDGTEVAVRMAPSPLRDADGIITGGLVMVTDVSSEEHTRHELSLREAWLDAIIMNAFDLVVGVSEAGVITFTTPSTLEILRLDESNPVVGTNIADYVHPDDLEETAAAFGRAIAGSNPRDPYECRIRRGDGTYIWVEFMATNFTGESAIDAVIVHGRDVTERVEATEKLARNEAWLEAILHQAFDVVVAIDAEGTVTFATAGLESYLARSLDTLVGTPLLTAVHAEDRAAVTEALVKVQKQPGSSESIEVRVVRPGGSFIWIEAMLTNLLLDPVVERIIINARDITDRHLAEAKIAFHAMHDALTGLPNRYLLGDRLDHAMARREEVGSNVAVAFIDLDHFKVLNDSSGHSIGDSALREVANRLRRVCRAGDTVARFGGDEFVLISESVDSMAQARELGERVLTTVFGTPFELRQRGLHITASIGVALGETGVSADRLLADADTAMYRAKAMGRNRVELFEPSMREAATSQLETVEILRRAVEDGDLVVHFQPIVTLPGRDIVGAEALVRLQHPVLGLMAPGEFIPLAESTGLIDSIGLRTFELACIELSLHLAISPDMPFSMSINVSPVQLRSARILELPDIAKSVGVDPHNIVLEITESTLFSEDEILPGVIAELRSHGFRIAVDDFGTGYSSLSHLKRMAVDIVKLDQLFTAGVGTSAEDTAIVDAVLAMARALDLTVVAEGVETAEQAAALSARGCPQAQGFLFSRPLPAEELRKLMSQQFLPV